jgi:hypothetical protein
VSTRVTGGRFHVRPADSEDDIALAPLADQEIERRDALAARLFEAAIGTLDVFCVYIGDRLGFYEALARTGPSTSTELATSTGTHERYVRECLEQQAAGGLLNVDDVLAEPTTRRFSIPSGHDEVLVDRDRLSHVAPLARLAVDATRPLDSLLQVFRVGGGVPFATMDVGWLKQWALQTA